MKITKSYLKQIIKEELQRLGEAEPTENPHFADPSSVKSPQYGQGAEEFEEEIKSIPGLGNLNVSPIDHHTYVDVEIRGTRQQEERVKQYLKQQQIPFSIEKGLIVVTF